MAKDHTKWTLLLDDSEPLATLATVNKWLTYFLTYYLVSAVSRCYFYGVILKDILTEQITVLLDVPEVKPCGQTEIKCNKNPMPPNRYRSHSQLLDVMLYRNKLQYDAFEIH